jgi:hypothetical protein
LLYIALFAPADKRAARAFAPLAWHGYHPDLHHTCQEARMLDDGTRMFVLLGLGGTLVAIAIAAALAWASFN